MGLVSGGQHVRIARECLVVVGCRPLPCRDILVEVRQFRVKHRRLNSVQPRVHADTVVMVAHHHTMVGNSPHLSRQLVIVGEYRTPVAVTAEVLRREETGAPYVAHGPCLPRRAVWERVLRPDGLACVLHHVQVVLPCNRHNRLHISALTEQMHGHDSLRAGRDSLADSLRRYVHRVPIYIYHYGCETQQRSHLCRCDKRERGGDNLVAGA